MAEPSDELEGTTFKDLCDNFSYVADEYATRGRLSQTPSRFEEDAISTGFEHLKSNKINRRGLGPLIIEHKRNGYSLAAIAEIVGEPYKHVKLWWDTFQSLSPKQKKVFVKAMHEHSVYNLPQRMEDIYRSINEMAESMRATEPELFLRAQEILLKQQKLAYDQMKEVNSMERRKKELDIITDEIRKESPECQARIRKRLKTLDQTKGLLG